MFVREHSLFLHNLTSFEHMFIISNILKVKNGDSNDIYDIVSNEARGRAVVDLREVLAIQWTFMTL